MPNKKLMLSNDVELNPGPNNDYATKEDIKLINDRLDKVITGIDNVNKQYSTFNDKINDLEDRIDANESTTEESCAEIKRLSNKLGFLESKFENLKSDLDSTQKENVKLRKQVNDLEDRNKRNNLIFSGIPQDKHETWQQSEDKVVKVMRDHMKLNTGAIEIERAHRISNGPTQNGAKPIIVKFVNYKDKEKVLSSANKLKGSNIYVNQDYCKNTRDVQKILCDKRNEMKDNVRKATIRYKKLVVTDQGGNVSVFEYNEDAKEIVSK